MGSQVAGGGADLRPPDTGSIRAASTHVADLARLIEAAPKNGGELVADAEALRAVIERMLQWCIRAVVDAVTEKPFGGEYLDEVSEHLSHWLREYEGIAQAA